jgi:DnaJ-class molecular chaperone
MPRDTVLYDRLEVSYNASTEEIQKVGRKMSMKWHPDKNINNREEAEKKFKEVREAVDILTDPEKRKLYDQYGIEGLNRVNEEPGPANFSFPFPFNRQNEPEHVVHNISCSLEQIAREEVVTFTYPRKMVCDGCEGEGGKNTIICNKCNGRGMHVQIIQLGPMTQQTMGPCQSCNGTGRQVRDKCTTCKGKTFVIIQETGTIKLQNGLENGMKVKVDGRGNRFKNGTTDLIIVINEEPHEAFTRKGENVYVDIDLTLYEALFGFRKIVYHLDGRILRVSYSGKTNYGTSRKIVNEGFSNLRKGGVKGDLYLRFVFDLPDLENVYGIQPPSSLDEDKVDEDKIIDVDMKDVGVESRDDSKEEENVYQQQQCRPM